MHPAGVPELRARAGRRRGGRTHFADDLAQQEKVQLAEDEEDRSQDVVPHRARLVEHPEHDVRHDKQVEQRGAGGGRVSTGPGVAGRRKGGSRAGPNASEREKGGAVEVRGGI